MFQFPGYGSRSRQTNIAEKLGSGVKKLGSVAFPETSIYFLALFNAAVCLSLSA